MLKWDTLEFKKTYKPIFDIILGFVGLAILYVIFFFLYYVVRTESGVTGGFAAQENSFFKWAACIIFVCWLSYNLYDKDKYICYQIEFTLDGEEFDDVMFDGPYIAKYRQDVSTISSNVGISDKKYYLFGIEPTNYIEYLWLNKGMKGYIKEQFERHMSCQRLAHKDLEKDLLKEKAVEDVVGQKTHNKIETDDIVSALNKESQEGRIAN